MVDMLTGSTKVSVVGICLLRDITRLIGFHDYPPLRRRSAGLSLPRSSHTSKGSLEDFNPPVFPLRSGLASGTHWETVRSSSVMKAWVFSHPGNPKTTRVTKSAPVQEARKRISLSFRSFDRVL